MSVARVHVWSRRFVALLVGTALLSAPVAGQQPAPAPQAPAAQAQTGPSLPLSMEQAVQMALENNLGLKSERLAPEGAALGIAAARSAFLPFVSSTVFRNSAQSQPLRNPDGTETVPSSTQLNGRASFQQALPWYGGNVSVSWFGDRRATASSSTYNPQLASNFSFSFTQPLWQDFRIDNNRANLELAERNKVIVDIQLEQRIIETEASVQGAYLTLVAFIEGFKVAQTNMEIAETSLRNAQARVKVGQAPEIEISTAEAAVESNRDQVIQAQARIALAEDNLRALVLNPDQPDFWTVRIEPTDKIQLTPRQIDVDAAITNALANRLDLIALKRNLEITDLRMRSTENLTRPSVDFGVDYSASGSGGTRLEQGQIVDVRGFGTVMADAFGGTYPSWTFRVTASYPIGRSGAEANLAQQEIQRRQQTMDQRELELAIVQQVRQAARQVQTTFQRVQATAAARAASQRQLDAEDQKIQVGLSDAFQLQQRQQQLAGALVNELNAMIVYNQALIEFDRVQKIR